MNTRNTQNLLYSIIFFLLAIVSYYREETITVVITLAMSVFLAFIYIVFSYGAKKEELTLQAEH